MTERLLPLLHLCDSLFPTGAFAHSDGLEWATDRALVSSAADLGEWMDATLSQVLGRADGPAVWLAWHAFMRRDWQSLDVVNAEALALRPSAVSRQATRAIGVEARAAVEGFIYTRLASTASAAMRLMAIGQHEAHRVLASRLRAVGPIVEGIAVQPVMSSFAPAQDIAAMSHQYVHSRLFKS